MTSVCYTASDELSSRARPRSMDPIGELFMFLCRLKCGFLAEDLSVRFNIHRSSISRKIITRTNNPILIVRQYKHLAQQRNNIETHATRF